MLVTDPAFPNENATEPQLYTITAGGFSATADAFARDPETDGLWFLSMVGSQTALKAIWAALLKQPPEAAFLIRGRGRAAARRRLPALHRPRQRRSAPGRPRSRACPLRAAGTRWSTRGWPSSHSSASSFLLLAPSEREAPALHRRFLDHRSDLPLHPLLGRLALAHGTERRDRRRLAVGRRHRLPLPSPDHERLREQLSVAVAAGRLTLPKQPTTDPIKNGATR